MSMLRGNYKLPALLKPALDATPTQKFEEAALKRLGGSIAFVARKKVIWVTPKR